MNKPLTTIDFSEHEFKTYSDKYCKIFELKIPNTHMNSIQYINCCGIMTVTGDFGNWVFCREFHPNADGLVSAEYWDEKLRMASEQDSHEYDAKATIKLIDEFKEEYLFENEEVSDDMTEWFDELESNVFDKYDYIISAYRNCPTHLDADYVPFGKIRHKWLEYIYDGFDEMCKRIKLEQTNDQQRTI